MKRLREVGLALAVLTVVALMDGKARAQGTQLPCQPVGAVPAAKGNNQGILLGTAAGPVSRALRSEPASALVVNDELYLIDAGDGVSRQLLRADFQPYQANHIFFTHLHLDHTMGLAPLLGFIWVSQKSAATNIYGPPGVERVVKGSLDFLAVGMETHQAEFPPSFKSLATIVHAHQLYVGATPQEVYRDKNVCITAVQNSHYALIAPGTLVPSPESYSYRFETPGRSVVFTGDTGPSDAVIALAQNADVLVSEVIAIDQVVDSMRKSYGLSDVALAPLIEHQRREHLTPDEVGKLAAAAHVKSVVLYHESYGSNEKYDPSPVLQTIGRYYTGKVVAGEDLTRF